MMRLVGLRVAWQQRRCSISKASVVHSNVFYCEQGGLWLAISLDDGGDFGFKGTTLCGQGRDTGNSGGGFDC